MDPLNFNDRDFVHLHLHSDYSLLQGAIQLGALATKLTELGMKACAVTDYGNMYAAISFYKQMKSAGVRPIIGYEAHVASGSRFDRSNTVEVGEKPFYSLILLATSMEGYENLVHISSAAFTEGLHHKPRVDKELLAKHSGGLIALSGGSKGAVWHYLESGNLEKARNYAAEISDIFGPDNFYLEIEDHGIPEQKEVVKKIVSMARLAGTPVVATNNAHYLTREDARAHEVLLCIGEGRTMTDPTHPSLPNDTYYVRTAEEMWELFGDEYPDALTNTLKIAERCELELAVGDGNLTLPVFPIPEESGCKTIDEYFEQVTRVGFEARKRDVLDPMAADGTLKRSFDDYEHRLKLEIEIIERMGYSGYFLIVWDFINYAVKRGIPVGPGRGSAAGSLVAYSLGITGIDPLQYDLFFERFLNPERISMPDIDIDFCIRGRGEVIRHVSDFYGRDSVCQIITFGTMASKAAIKDVGRALNMPLGDVEKIAKLIPPPFRGRITSISKAIKDVKELREAMAANPKVNELIDLALRIEGCARHTSVHAAGVVISPKPLHEIVPVAISAKNELTSQYPMGDLEKVGMLKMDFLGLTTLTIISDCLEALKEKTGTTIDWSEVPLNDRKTMELFGEGKTDAVFQFESSGMQEICRRLKPKELEDLSALNALYRPGPIDGGMIEEFILRHRGEKDVSYLVPEMEEILKNTFGVLVYQEQIMQIAQKLAGYSLGDADLMRRAMGKKKPEEMAPHEIKFIEGAVERGIEKKKAKEIFDLMAKFADYGFNRSHSIAYAYVAFQTAYLKAHYPAYFYAAVLSHEADDSAKVYKYSNELRGLGLNLLPPDVNESDEGFTPGDGSVRFGLSAIKGMGSAAAKAIIEARKDGRFTSLYDFVSRVDHTAINRKSMESLAAAGAFDSMKPETEPVNVWRAKTYAAIDDALAFGQNAWNDKVRGQSGLFGGPAESVASASLPDVDGWSQAEMSAKEKASLGFYLSAHPLDDYKSILKSLGIRNIADYENITNGQQMLVAGVVSGLQVRWSKKGNRFAQFHIEDQSTGLRCLMWGEEFGKYADAIENDQLLIVEGKIKSNDGQDTILMAAAVRSLTEAVSKNARALKITLPKGDYDEQYFQDLCSVLSSSPGRCEVHIKFPVGDVVTELRSGPMRVEGSRKLEKELRSRGCIVDWIL